MNKGEYNDQHNTSIRNEVQVYESADQNPV